MQVDKHPYEILFRFGPDGSLSGGHVQWALIARGDDGKIVSNGWTPQPPQTIAAGEHNGFPLSDVLNELHIGAVKTAEAAVAERDAAMAATARAAEEKSSALALVAKVVAAAKSKGVEISLVQGQE